MTKQIILILSWFFGLIITGMMTVAIFFLVEKIIKWSKMKEGTIYILLALLFGVLTVGLVLLAVSFAKTF